MAAPAAPALCVNLPALRPHYRRSGTANPQMATRLTANSLWKQTFGGTRGGWQQPLCLASRDFILYPEQSAAAGIRFM